jgi:hypothetical protein
VNGIIKINSGEFLHLAALPSFAPLQPCAKRDKQQTPDKKNRQDKICEAFYVRVRLFMHEVDGDQGHYRCGKYNRTDSADYAVPVLKVTNVTVLIVLNVHLANSGKNLSSSLRYCQTGNPQSHKRRTLAAFEFAASAKKRTHFPSPAS